MEHATKKQRKTKREAASPSSSRGGDMQKKVGLWFVKILPKR